MSKKRIGALTVLATTVTGLLAAALPTHVLADPNCTCRGLGRNFDVGETACLETPKGPRIATCGMALNNTSWLFSDTPCVAAHRVPPIPDKQAKSEAVGLSPATSTTR